MCDINSAGHQQYVCSSCEATFPQPNMLKAHLRLNWCIYERDGLPTAPRENRDLVIHVNPVDEDLTTLMHQDDNTSQSSRGRQDNRAADEVLTMTPDTNTSNDEEDVTTEELDTLEDRTASRKKGHMCMFCGKIYSRRFVSKTTIPSVDVGE